MEAKASRIEVELQRDLKLLRLYIRDDGMGMNQDQIQHAFEPFFTTKATGTGLGLAISRQELEDVGGTLSATSLGEQGCQFCLTIPYTQA